MREERPMPQVGHTGAPVARALVRKPKLLLLDEVTASLDPSAESTVIASSIPDRSSSQIALA